MSQAEAALETALDSSGSAARENERYIDSINGKLATLDSAIQTFSHNLLSSDLYKFMIDIAIAGVETTNKLGALATVVGVVTTAFLALTKKDVLIGVANGLDKLIGACNLASFGLTGVANSAIATRLALSALAGVGITAAVALLSAGWNVLSTWIDNLNVTLEEHLDLIKDARTVYEEQADKVQRLTQTVQELEATLTGINNGTLKLVDGQTITGLQRELELQSMLLEIEKQREETSRNKLDSEIISALGDTSSKKVTTGRGSYTTQSSKNSMHHQLLKEIEETEKLYSKYIEAAEKASQAGATDNDRSNLVKAQQEYSEMRSQMESTLYTITDLTKELSSNSEHYKKYNDELDDSIKRYNEFKVSVGEVDTLLGDTSNILDQNIATTSDLSGVIEELDDATSLLSKAQEEMNESGALQLDTIKELIDAGKTELLYLDEETGAIKLNTVALKAQTLARVADEIATINEAIVINEGLINALNEEMNARGRTTEMINKQAAAQEALNALYHKRDIFTGLQKNIETDTYLKSDSKTSSKKDTNEQLEHYKKQLAHAKKMDKYRLKEDEYIQKLVYAYTKLCKTAEERQEIEEMIYEAQQDFNERLADDYEKQQEALEKLIEYSIKMIKKQKEEEVDAIDKATKAYEKEYDARKKLLKDEESTEDYNRELAKKQKAVTDIESKLTALQYDDSAEAAKKRLKLEEDLAEAKAELEEHQRERYFDEQEDALDEEKDRFEEAQEEKKDVIEEYLKDEGKVRKDALDAMESDYEAFYDKLEEYCVQYEGYISQEIKDAWYDAKTALDAFNESQIDVAGTLQDLIDKQKQLNDVIEPMYYSTEEYKGSSNGSGNSINAAGSYYLSSKAKTNYDSKVNDIVRRLVSAKNNWEFNDTKDELQEYIKSLGNILDMPAVKADEEITKYYEKLLALLMNYRNVTFKPNAIKPYLSGGVVDQYGMAMLHGDKRHSEVVFSSEDAKKLWSLIHNIPEFQTDRPSNVGANTNQEISIGEVMSVTIESGAVVTDEVLGELRNIATQVKKEFVDSLSKTGYRANLASRRL